MKRVPILLLLLFSGPALIYALSATGTITTIAGDGTACTSATDPCGDGGPATAAQLNGPTGVVLDEAGDLYIADHLNHRVRKVLSAAGVITTVAGDGTECLPATDLCGDGGPATSAPVQWPTGIALDEAGNLYIASETRIRKLLAATGVITTVAGDGTSCGAGLSTTDPCGDGGLATEAQLAAVFDVAVDGLGNLYLADYVIHRIRKVEAATGVITTVAGDGNNGFEGDGGPATTARLSSPRGVAVDKAGNLYIADAGNHRIRKISAATGVITTVAGDGVPCSSTTAPCGDGGPATAAQLYAPLAIAVDRAGNLYIADGHRVRKVSVATGLITTVAGDGQAGFGGDGGPATAAQLNQPVGVALAGTGDFFIADASNHRIRKIEGLPLAPPEIVVLEETTPISDNTGVVDFGTTTPGLPLTKTFTISNAGDLELTLTPPITTPAGFSLANSFGSPVVGGHSTTTFQLRLDAAATGVFSGGLAFETNDPDENPFDFTVSGVVTTTISGPGQKIYLPAVLKQSGQLK